MFWNQSLGIPCIKCGVSIVVLFFENIEYCASLRSLKSPRKKGQNKNFTFG